MKIVRSLLLVVVALEIGSDRERSTNQSMSDQSDETDLFVSWQNPDSQRHAILEELDGMVWLYLTAPDSAKLGRDCPAFSTVILVDKVDWKLIEDTGASPPIYKEVASSIATMQDPRASDFDVRWSPDGESVALVRDGQVICMIVAGVDSRSFPRSCQRVSARTPV